MGNLFLVSQWRSFHVDDLGFLVLQVFSACGPRLFFRGGWFSVCYLVNAVQIMVPHVEDRLRFD